MFGARRSLALGTKRGWLPKHYRDLPAPEIKRKWNDVSKFSSKERKEVMGGTWRSAPEVEIEVKKEDFPDWKYSDGKQTISFRTEEEYRRWEEKLEKESGQQRVDAIVSSSKPQSELLNVKSQQQDGKHHELPSVLLAASQFHAALQATANDELAPSSESALKSDEDREAELAALNVDLAFNFYCSQGSGMIFPYEREAFVRSLTTPPDPLFQVNPQLPLVRLVTQSQLNTHAKTFSPHPSRDGIYQSSSVNGLSVHQLHWLQRNVASGALIVPDPASILIPPLMVGPPSQLNGVQADSPPPLILLDVTGTNSDFDSLFADISAYFRHCDMFEGNNSWRPRALLSRHFSANADLDDLRTLDTSHILADATSGLVLKEWTNLGTAVLCAPVSSQDGRRPNPELFAIDEIPVPRIHQFDELVREVYHRHLQQCKWVRAAVQAVAPGGRLVYVVRSLNPLEGEAVLCTALGEQLLAGELCPTSLLNEIAGRQNSEGLSKGLSSWRPVEGMGPELHPDQFSLELRQKIAKSSVRLSPWRSSLQSEGIFIAVLEKSQSQDEGKRKSSTLHSTLPSAANPTNKTGPHQHRQIIPSFPPMLPPQYSLAWNTAFKSGLQLSVPALPSTVFLSAFEELGESGSFVVCSAAAERSKIAEPNNDSASQTVTGVPFLRVPVPLTTGMDTNDTDFTELQCDLSDPQLTAAVLQSLGFPELHFAPEDLLNLLLAEQYRVQDQRRVPSVGGSVREEHVLNSITDSISSVANRVWQNFRESVIKRQNSPNPTKSGLFGSSSFLSDHSNNMVPAQPLALPIICQISTEFPGASRIHPQVRDELRRFSVCASLRIEPPNSMQTLSSAPTVPQWELQFNFQQSPVLLAQRDALAFLVKLLNTSL
jgi:hypothetical protein